MYVLYLINDDNIFNEHNLLVKVLVFLLLKSHIDLCSIDNQILKVHIANWYKWRPIPASQIHLSLKILYIFFIENNFKLFRYHKKQHLKSRLGENEPNIFNVQDNTRNDVCFRQRYVALHLSDPRAYFKRLTDDFTNFFFCLFTHSQCGQKNSVFVCNDFDCVAMSH